ncbi:MAG TPA: GGDEF domain-containing protein [Streptosporangiaceae bacterium]|nr:GGDEF domain-containing protein [Streptosporangiaceae bacterium]
MLLGSALLGCGIAAIESTRSVREAHGEVVRDLQSVWFLAIAVALPPAYAFLAPFPLMIYKLVRVPRLVIYRRVMSNATLSLGYGFASVVFHAIPASIAGPFPGIDRHALTWTASVAFCGLVAWFINCGLVVLAIKISDRGARLRDLVGTRESLTSDLLELSLAVSITLVVRINPILMALALPSVVLCKRSIMRSQLVSHARIDPKTGLLNAGTWQREAEAEFFRALRRGVPLALAMVNIDHFTDVHDMAGQSVRDQLIRDIASMLKDQLPGHDLIGRFGSDEFAILLPQTGRDEALRISERLRDHIAGEPIAIESGSQEGFVFRLTVSIGVAIMNESRRALAELIGAADNALGQAKSSGWSKVYVLPDAIEDPGN